jgi:multisubunit Na+/H+ antiporter MnhE subunit
VCLFFVFCVFSCHYFYLSRISGVIITLVFLRFMENDIRAYELTSDIE